MPPKYYMLVNIFKKQKAIVLSIEKINLFRSSCHKH